MFDQGAVLVVVVLAAWFPLNQDSDGWAKRALSAPTATVKQYATKAACEEAKERWKDSLEEFPLEGRTVKVFCVTP